MTRHLPLLLALAAALAGIDVAVAAGPTRGWGLADVALLWGLAFLGTAALLAPLTLARRAPGLLLGAAALLEIAPAVRFGPLVNEPLRSPVVLGALVGIAAVTLGVGWAIGDRVPRVAVLAGLLVGAGGFLAGAIEVLPRSHATDARGPNVVLVTIDTLRADRLGGRAETPTLDGLARDGATFTTAIASAPQTGPSHLSIHSGRLPLSTGVIANGTRSPGEPMLAEALRDAGYTTAAFVSAYPVNSRFGFDAGFDVYDDDFSPVPGLHDLAWMRLLDVVVFRNVPRERRGDATNARALRWLADRQGPFFLWVHYYDPHGPYTPPDPYDGRYTKGPPPTDGEPLPLPAYWPADQRAVTDPAWLEAQYDAEVAWTDHLLGELLAAVDAHGETLVVATSDHGESMTEHGVWFDHGDDLYDPALRVPLVVRGPGVKPGTVISAQTPAVDVLPTVLDLLGIADPAPRDGRSRRAALEGVEAKDRDAFASTVAARHADPPVHHALRRPSGKCIRRSDGPPLAFDLVADPGEGVGIELPELCAALDARVEAGATPLAGEHDAATLEALRALGYLDTDP